MCGKRYEKVHFSASTVFARYSRLWHLDHFPLSHYWGRIVSTIMFVAIGIVLAEYNI